MIRYIAGIIILAGMIGHSITALAQAGTEEHYGVHITSVPTSGAGENSAGTIAGTASGPDVSHLKIVVYAITDQAYVQPFADAPYTTIKNGKWSTGTHLGWHFAALLVRKTYQPPAVTDAIPGVGGDVLAVAKADPKP